MNIKPVRGLVKYQRPPWRNLRKNSYSFLVEEMKRPESCSSLCFLLVVSKRIFFQNDEIHSIDAIKTRTHSFAHIHLHTVFACYLNQLMCLHIMPLTIFLLNQELAVALEVVCFTLILQVLVILWLFIECPQRGFKAACYGLINQGMLQEANCLGSYKRLRCCYRPSGCIQPYLPGQAKFDPKYAVFPENKGEDLLQLQFLHLFVHKHVIRSFF